MLLEPHDAELFFMLHRSLMHFVNQRLKVLPDQPATPTDYSHLSPEARLKVHKAFLAHRQLLDSFVIENPAQLTVDQLEIVRSWQHVVAGKFYIFRELAKYTVFLSVTDPAIAYGVVALSEPIEEVVGPYLPVFVETTLLPFKGRIVYDGTLYSYRIYFGPGIRRSLNESFKAAKEQHGILTSLPMSAQPLPPEPPRPKPVPRPPSKQEKEQVQQVITSLIDQFCKEHLNEEYAVLCRRLAEKLARKRPSPLFQGSPNSWASGIVRVIGWVNFLHDKSQSPYMRATDIDHHFGVSESSGAAKAAAIRKMLRIRPLDPEWTLPSRLDDNPMVWILSVNGLMMDVREAPRAVQEAAFRKGLIPYIPADRPHTSID